MFETQVVSCSLTNSTMTGISDTGTVVRAGRGSYSKQVDGMHGEAEQCGDADSQPATSRNDATDSSSTGISARPWLQQILFHSRRFGTLLSNTRLAASR